MICLFIKREKNKRFKTLDILKNCEFDRCSETTRCFFMKTLVSTLDSAEDIKSLNDKIFSEDRTVKNFEKKLDRDS